MSALYHFSVVMQTTKVIHVCDLLKNMEETRGERLKRLRKARGLTQKDLAKAVGLGQTAIANIEADARGYGAGIVQIAKALGTTPEHLQLQDRATVAPISLSVRQHGPSYEWPFLTVTPSQYALLGLDDRAAVEQYIHLHIKARGDPEKHDRPANNIASG